MHEETLPVGLLRNLLRYQAKTGKLFWRERTPDMFSNGSHTPAHSCAKWNSRHAGKEAITADDGSGYLQGTILERSFRAHRIAWAIHYGEWPSKNIDHINGDRSDNRIENLREASFSENARNSKLPSDNTSGSVGVSWYKSRKKWQAYINDDTGRRGLGFFESKEDAIAARANAERRLGYHNNHGRLELDVTHG